MFDLDYVRKNLSSLCSSSSRVKSLCLTGMGSGLAGGVGYFAGYGAGQFAGSMVDRLFGSSVTPLFAASGSVLGCVAAGFLSKVVRSIIDIPEKDLLLKTANEKVARASMMITVPYALSNVAPIGFWTAVLVGGSVFQREIRNKWL